MAVNGGTRVMGYRWSDVPGSPRLRPGSVVVSSFPGAGLATTVAAHYLIRSLKLPRVGLVEGSETPPVAVVQGGIVHPPVRVYGRDDLALIMSEFPPTPAQASQLAAAILDGAIERRARFVLCLEGVVPHPVEDGAASADDDPDMVWIVYAQRNPTVEKMFAPARARLLEDGVIGGVTGALLVRAIPLEMPVATLLVSSRSPEGYPDHRAGAVLLETFDRLVPEASIDTAPIRAQAAQIERILRQSMKPAAKAASPEAAPMPAEMYR